MSKRFKKGGGRWVLTQGNPYHTGYNGHKKAKRKLKYPSSMNYRTGGYSGIEKKFLDGAWNNVAIATSSDGAGGEMQPSTMGTSQAETAGLCISATKQGTGEQERDGRRYTIKSISVSGAINTSPIQAAADVDSSFGYFFALVHDKQTNAQTMVSENVYLNPSSSPAGMLPFPLRNLANTRRFRILDSVYIRPGDMYSSTDGTNTASLSNQTAPVVKLSWSGSIGVDTKGTDGVIGSITDNSIALVAFGASTQLTPVFTGKFRMRFVG